MSTYIQYRAICNTFKPTQWTRTLIQTLHEYTYSQFIDCYNAVHGTTLAAPRATGRFSLMTQITETYHNSSNIPIDKWSITFGIPLTLQLEHTTITMEAWLLQHQARQEHLAIILTQECHTQGTIIGFLISHT